MSSFLPFPSDDRIVVLAVHVVHREILVTLALATRALVRGLALARLTLAMIGRALALAPATLAMIGRRRLPGRAVVAVPLVVIAPCTSTSVDDKCMKVGPLIG